MYEPPISLITQAVINSLDQKLGDNVIGACLKVGIDVNKHELIRALHFEREQYEKGYQDALDRIVHCRDCKHYHLFNEGFYDCSHTCGIDGANPDDFCSYGKKRGDTE